MLNEEGAQTRDADVGHSVEEIARRWMDRRTYKRNTNDDVDEQDQTLMRAKNLPVAYRVYRASLSEEVGSFWFVDNRTKKGEFVLRWKMGLNGTKNVFF